MKRSPWDDFKFKGYQAEVSRSISFTGVSYRFLMERKAEWILHALKGRGMNPARSLDLGCGPAAIHASLSFLSSSGDLWGVDVSADAIDSAKTAAPESRFAVYDGRTLPFENGEFDFVFSINVFHHVAENEQARLSQEAWRVLRPGGIFLAIEHNPLNPLTRLSVHRCPLDEGVKLIWPSEIRRLMAESGFSDPSVRHIFSVPFSGRAGFALDRLSSRLPFGAQYLALGIKEA